MELPTQPRDAPCRVGPGARATASLGAAVALLVPLVAAGDLGVSAESPPFALDTRPRPTVVLASAGVVTVESPAFALDTRQPPTPAVISANAGVVAAESPPFVLDTRPRPTVVPASAGVVTVESPAFALDTRQPPTPTVIPAGARVVFGESSNFTLDTIDTALGVLSNQFGFTITGPVNRVVVVEVCTNLANPVWYPLQTITLTTGAFNFTDPQWTASVVGIYRLRWP